MAHDKKAKAIPFPREVLVQHAVDTGDSDDPGNNWMTATDATDVSTLTHGVRAGVYKLDRIVVIEKTETFTEKPSK